MAKKPTYEELEQRIIELEIKFAREQAEKTLEKSDLKLKEKAMRESEERYRTLTERTSDLIWEVDLSGIYTYTSPKVKDLLGYESDEIIGKTPFDFMPDDEAERVARLFEDIVRSEEPFQRLENTNIHKEGRHVTLETSGVPILDTNGNLRGYRGVDRDITKRKQAEEEKEKLQAQLQQAQKMEAIVTLAGGTAHDFNNLLMGIQGRASLASMELDASHPHSEHIDAIEEYIRNATGLTKQLLGFARGGKYENKTTDINELVLNGATMFGRTKREIQPQIPVMLSSGYAINGQAEKIMRRGCNGFIQKPFNLFEFSKQVRKILDGAKN